MKQELVTLHEHLGSLPGFLVGSVLILFLVFVVLCLVSIVGCLVFSTFYRHRHSKIGEPYNLKVFGSN